VARFVPPVAHTAASLAGSVALFTAHRAGTEGAAHLAVSSTTNSTSTSTGSDRGDGVQQSGGEASAEASAEASPEASAETACLAGGVAGGLVGGAVHGALMAPFVPLAAGAGFWGPKALQGSLGWGPRLRFLGGVAQVSMHH
jgi:hypothetical protein